MDRRPPLWKRGQSAKVSPMSFDRKSYLARIGLASAPASDLAGLASLQRAQLFSIPFENFDIHLGRGISLEPAAIFQKLVTRRRGGYCFEVNELFFTALEAFGFKARRALARIRFRPEPSGLTHQVTLVTFGAESWMVDTGFGAETPRRPLLLQDGFEITQDGLAWRLSADGTFGWLLSQWEEGAWKPLYSFEERPVLAPDRIMGNHYTSSHPTSFFTFTRIAALAKPWGQISLLDRRLAITKDGIRQEEELPDGPAYLAVLRELFGIELDAPYEALRPLHPPPV